MSFATARQQSQGPLRLVSITASQSDSPSCSIGPRMLMPALLTRMSSRPRPSTTRATMSSTWAATATSAATPSVLRPLAFAISSATRWAAAPSRAEIATSAPASASASAIARPRPLVPPVTSATRPSSRNRSIAPAMPRSPVAAWYRLSVPSQVIPGTSPRERSPVREAGQCQPVVPARANLEGGTHRDDRVLPRGFGDNAGALREVRNI